MKTKHVSMQAFFRNTRITRGWLPRPVWKSLNADQWPPSNVQTCWCCSYNAEGASSLSNWSAMTSKSGNVCETVKNNNSKQYYYNLYTSLISGPCYIITLSFVFSFDSADSLSPRIRLRLKCVYDYNYKLHTSVAVLATANIILL